MEKLCNRFLLSLIILFLLSFVYGFIMAVICYYTGQRTSLSTDMLAGMVIGDISGLIARWKIP